MSLNPPLEGVPKSGLSGFWSDKVTLEHYSVAVKIIGVIDGFLEAGFAELNEGELFVLIGIFVV